jgi:hypothetical protein
MDTYKLLKDCVDNKCLENPYLNVLSWNIHCLNNKKLNILKQYLDEWSRSSTLGNCNNNFPITCSGARKNYFIDIISLTETWLDSENKFEILSIKNYNSFAASRVSGKKGGGILVYIHKNYPSFAVESVVNDNIELLLVKIIAGSNEYHVLTIYRPPNGDLNVFVEMFEEVVLKVNRDKLIINGDMNLNVLNANEMDIKNYLDMLTSLNLFIKNKAVTRLNPITGIGTLLDHVILSDIYEFDHNYISFTSKRINLMSDHNFVMLMYRMPKMSLKDRIIKFKKSNIDAITDEFYNNLSQLDTRIAELNLQPVDVYFSAVHEILINAVSNNSKFVKVKLPTTHQTLPKWADNNYIEMLNTLYNLEEKIDFRRSKGLECDLLQLKFDELNSIREKYGDVKAKSYYRRLEINNLSDAWKIINELAGRNKKKDYANMMIESSDGSYLFQPEEIAEAFQMKFLKTVGNSSTECNIVNHKYLGKSISNSFVFEETTPQEIFIDIGALLNRKASGYDEINASVLKSCSEGVCVHLANIFNLMVRSGKYPDRLKIAMIKPIPKNGNTLSLENSRPISLLPLIDKVFENLICKQLNRFFEHNRILDKYQYGFRSGRGCPDALCMILNHVSKLLNVGKGAILMSFDIEKAFDTVCHRILLRKLNFLGMRGASYDLLKSFLSSRKQFVKINDAQSQFGTIFSGVPQGSNLGPLLFTIMLNDLSSLNTNSTLYKYADDLIAVFPVDPNNFDSDVLKLSIDIKLLTEFYENNHLKVNYGKSKFISIGSCAPKLKEVLTSMLVQESESLKYLGFILDSELKMISHVDRICSSLAQGINALRFLKQNLTTQALMKFFHAHLQSHISYCSFALLRCRSIDIERIQRLQSKALKIILDLPVLHSTFELFTINAKKVLCVVGLIYNSALIMVKKSLLCKDDSLPLIKKARSTRRMDLIPYNAKRKVMSDDITNIGCKLYNELPMDIKTENNFFLYKVMLKQFLLSRNESLVKHGQFSNKNFYL